MKTSIQSSECEIKKHPKLNIHSLFGFKSKINIRSYQLKFIKNKIQTIGRKIEKHSKLNIRRFFDLGPKINIRSSQGNLTKNTIFDISSKHHPEHLAVKSNTSKT